MTLHDFSAQNICRTIQSLPNHPLEEDQIIFSNNSTQSQLSKNLPRYFFALEWLEWLSSFPIRRNHKHSPVPPPCGLGNIRPGIQERFSRLSCSSRRDAQYVLVPESIQILELPFCFMERCNFRPVSTSLARGAQLYLPKDLGSGVWSLVPMMFLLLKTSDAPRHCITMPVNPLCMPFHRVSPLNNALSCTSLVTIGE